MARGALLLECAHFVHRCNKGQWPSWLLSSHPSSRRGKGGFGALVRNAIAVSRRNVRIKHEAGLMFYKWAVAIGERLEQIEFRKKPESERKEVDSNKLLEEDFLDEGKLFQFSFFLNIDRMVDHFGIDSMGMCSMKTIGLF